MTMSTSNDFSSGADTAINTYAEASLEAQAMALPECAGGESFALMVMGHSMAPEFMENEIILVEPEGLAKDGSYVLAWHADGWTFRQLVRASSGWLLHPLNPAFADEPIADLQCVRGVIIQKALPGRRRASNHYV
jgi:SOS-response transcriptional repressor LexA